MTDARHTSDFLEDAVSRLPSERRCAVPRNSPLALLGERRLRCRATYQRAAPQPLSGEDSCVVPGPRCALALMAAGEVGVGQGEGARSHRTPVVAELRDVEAQAEGAAAEFVGAPKPKRRKGRRFSQEYKVATLEKGREWYRYLSNHFTHGKASDWRGLSSRGGVISIDTVEDEFAFLGLMDYLVNQVAVMNASAALCPVARDADDQWNRWVEPGLAQLRDVGQSSKALRRAALGGATGGVDGSTRTD